MSIPRDVYLMYMLVRNPGAIFGDDAHNAVLIKGPKANVVDLIDWASETAEERRSVRLQVLYLFGRMQTIITDVFGPKGMEHFVGVDLRFSGDDKEWNAHCMDALDRMSAAIGFHMKEPRLTQFLKERSLLPDADVAAVVDCTRIRESLRLAVQFVQLVQVDRCNAALDVLGPAVQSTRGMGVLTWFRAQKIATRHTADWVQQEARELIDSAKKGRKAGESAGDASMLMRFAFGTLVCRLPDFASIFPETLLLDRVELQRCHAEFGTMASMLVLADAARHWASYTHGTERAHGFIRMLDSIDVSGVTLKEYEARICDLKDQSMEWDGAKFIDDDLNDTVRRVRGTRAYRYTLKDVLIASLQNHGVLDKEVNKRMPVSPIFLPRIQEWCLSVHLMVNANLAVFMPIYEDLMVHEPEWVERAPPPPPTLWGRVMAQWTAL